MISRVNKIVCFKVRELNYGSDGSLTAKLSRREAQEECQRNYIEKLRAGDIIEAKVTHLEQFGSFVDIGCGIPSLIPIDTISVSRISHPSDRMRVGQMIYAAVKSNESARICLTHKELLGTWEENAADYEVGETVSGIDRSVESYGIFVELTPNLAGLAETRDGITAGMHVSVYIKAIIPEKMKVKLVIVDSCDSHDEVLDFKYRFRESHINKWAVTRPSNPISYRKHILKQKAAVQSYSSRFFILRMRSLRRCGEASRHRALSLKVLPECQSQRSCCP